MPETDILADQPTRADYGDALQASDSTVRLMQLGVSRHMAYHARQISLLARQIAGEEVSS